jgi:hypothetical protein
MKHLLSFALLLTAVGTTTGVSSIADETQVKGWTISYSPNMPARMEESKSGTYSFYFPPKDGVHYVTAAAPPVGLNQTVIMRFSIAGDGMLLPTQGKPPARVRLFLEQRGDRMTASEPFKRWWSVAHVDLVSRRHFTLAAQLVPGQWSSVFGKNGSAVPNKFRDCLASLDKIGFTFGGGFAGHGVYVVGGSARFVLESFTVTSTPSSSQR